MTRLVDLGLRYGVPVMAVTAVGRDMVRDAKYFRLACRICAELGAHYVKTYYVADGFDTVTASCPVPIVPKTTCWRMRSSVSGSENILSVIGLRTLPGETQFMLIPCLPSDRAPPRVSWVIAALAAQ
jgi:hypothetical protein